MHKTTLLGIFITLIMLGAPSTTSANEKDRLYKLYGDAPKGSKLRPIEATSYIPFNKEYSQLSERQKKIYRADFQGLQPDQIPPFPEGGVNQIYEPLIQGHARIGGGGELLLFADIDEEGVAQKVTVYKSPTEELAELATTVVFNLKFHPATCAGEPCAMEFPFLFDVPHRNRELKSLNKEDFGKGDIDTAYSK
ncbi:hypothetical protein [Arenicella xantha]|uniref:TonB-like protein n=1 Tax=Arenicella xantha TaxID=644221 RepID=A0A395JJG8_9GAMM|nr:hypothetical protein [Arenicella xantha]RBP49899.1 hypothetical protein DFR28_103331 [Arenicella xantha]